MKLTHDEIKELLEKYKEQAKLKIIKYDEITVNNSGTVHLMNDGAYIDCVIWISRDEL